MSADRCTMYACMEVEGYGPLASSTAMQTKNHMFNIDSYYYYEYAYYYYHMHSNITYYPNILYIHEHTSGGKKICNH